MNRLRWLFVGALVIAAVAGTVVISTATPKYEATAQVLLKRPQLERAGGASEESKNRWVWVRDGMELRHHMMSEDVLSGIATGLNATGQTIDVPGLRRMISVNYSGGDDNLFTIRVKDVDAGRAARVAEAYLSVFPQLAVGERYKALVESIKALDGQSSSGDSEAEKARRAEILETLRSDLAFAHAENDRRIIVIERPGQAKKIWPRPLFIYVAAGVIALFLACLIAVIFRLNGSR